MKRATRSTQAWEYIPLADRPLPESEQTVIVFRPLTVEERMRAFDAQTWLTQGDDGKQTVAQRAFQNALRLAVDCIYDVRNFPPGAPEQWPTGRDRRLKYMEGFPDEVIYELGNEIIQQSIIGPAEKNSSAPSLTSS